MLGRLSWPGWQALRVPVGMQDQKQDQKQDQEQNQDQGWGQMMALAPIMASLLMMVFMLMMAVVPMACRVLGRGRRRTGKAALYRAPEMTPYRQPLRDCPGSVFVHGLPARVFRAGCRDCGKARATSGRRRCCSRR